MSMFCFQCQETAAGRAVQFADYAENRGCGKASGPSYLYAERNFRNCG
ncbi:MAG: hypothetical protein BWY46_00383 [Firmicutes bacterium ADurb.Bin300]|nr:MAG: hypothetical protein BWY46_00383 [Firmicutes bacterium ADurb.Bin300]